VPPENTRFERAYLSDAEYRYVDDRVFAHWLSGGLQSSREAALESKLAARIHDASVRVTERLNAATEERLKTGHAVGALSIA
jgi:hypothetical protein